MKKKVETIKPYMSVQQLAEALGISKTNAYALCQKDDFPAVRISPRRIIIPADALAEWMKTNAGV